MVVVCNRMRCLRIPGIFLAGFIMYCQPCGVHANDVSTNLYIGPLTNDSTLTWLWTTQCYVDVQTDMHGSVSPGSGWYDAGTNVVATATADTHYHFLRWTGSGTSNISVGIPENDSVTLSVTSPIQLQATFAENLASNGTPEWWMAEYGWSNDFDAVAMADQDGDGAPTWAEFVAGTVPTNSASVLELGGISNGVGGNVVLRWYSVSNVFYAISTSSSNLVSGFEVIESNIPATPTENVYTDSVHDATMLFYRIEVE